MNKIDPNIEKMFFRPVCNEAEIERVFNVMDAKDHLLHLRAKTIVDHMRLYRVYRYKALRNESSWSLESSFDDEHYKAVLKKLPSDERLKCDEVTYGDVFSNDPNGMIFKTPFGPVTTISESLQFFLKFAHLAILEFKSEVPGHVKFNALRIAIRVMLKTEAMDFYMDPRGILPKDIAKDIHAPIPLQKQFIAGHEFAHHLLEHLSDKNVREQPIFFAISSSDKDYRPEKIYNASQQHEFEADVQSILLPNYSDQERSELLGAALLWFACLELYEAVSETMSPQSATAYLTHPSARARYDNLLTRIPTPKGFDTKSWKEFPKFLNQLKKELLEDVSLNFEAYEMEGSIYLDKPDTLWRGKELIDRVDY